MNLLSKAWGYVAVALGAIAAFALAYLKGAQAGKNTERVKSTQKARETEHKATEALTTGLNHEQDALAVARARRSLRKSQRMRDDSNEPPATPTSLDS